MALVIKQWSAAESPASGGDYVRIHGREQGLLSFLLSLVGIDPTTTLCIDRKSVRLEQGSLQGFSRSVTPLSKVATAVYGYEKPWKEAVINAVVGIALLAVPVAGWVFGILLLLYAPIHYFLNKNLFLVIRDAGGGRVADIKFKRSVIEGQSIDERAGERIVNIVEMLLLDLDRPRAPQVKAAAAGGVAERAGAELGHVVERTRQRVDEIKAAARERIADAPAAGLGRSAVTLSAPAASGSAGASTASAAALSCPKCRSPLQPGDAFCATCGLQLS